ncbi:MAG: hypothetical protein M1838_005250 [Thelocarpon superellum]|nr:MAG: hypothetical protein M1838_005250 [Thelocarpon superellum]
MSFGKFYTRPENSRSTGILAIAKANKIDLEIVEASEAERHTEKYKALNPLSKIPTFEGPNGFVLTECIAIAVYIASQDEKTPLLGSTKQDYASILRWMSFANMEFIPPYAGWVLALQGKLPYNKKSVDEHQAHAVKVAEAFDKHLLVHTFLVGERITLADIFTAPMIGLAFKTVFDKKWRADHPNVTRWYETMQHQSILKAVVEPITFVNEAIKYTPQKKEKEAAPKQEKAKTEPKAKAKAKEVDEDEEEEDKPAPRPKHPLESLPKATLVLDDWKRKYSNAETREEALPWFWQNYNAEEYSLWRVDYKYPEELTQIFMTSNLIGGFFARLEASRKYIFGAASVFGAANDSAVVGAFLVRGQEALPAFDVAPDYESYEFTKLDATKPADKAFVEDMWAWDQPTEVKGKTYPWADGKVFK